MFLSFHNCQTYLVTFLNPNRSNELNEWNQPQNPRISSFGCPCMWLNGATIMRSTIPSWIFCDGQVDLVTTIRNLIIFWDFYHFNSLKYSSARIMVHSSYTLSSSENHVDLRKTQALNNCIERMNNRNERVHVWGSMHLSTKHLSKTKIKPLQ